MPNIAHYILNNEPFTSSIKLTGIAIGNACWGGNATHVECNGTMQYPPHRSTALGHCCVHSPAAGSDFSGAVDVTEVDLRVVRAQFF